jgi:hypothetical protein
MSNALPRLLAVSLLLPLLAAGACKDEPTVVVTFDAETRVKTSSEGATVETAKEGGSLAVDVALPAFAPAYPGARLTTRIADDKDGKRGSLLVFRSDDPVEKIAAFYDARAKEAGIEPAMIVTEADSAVRIFGGTDKQDHKSGALIAISRSDEGTGTEIVITSGMATADVTRMEQDQSWREVARPPVRLQ